MTPGTTPRSCTSISAWSVYLRPELL